MGLFPNLCIGLSPKCLSFLIQHFLLKDSCLRHTDAQVNGNYFYLVYRQTLWAVKTDALILILYRVSVIVSCFLLLHANICYFQFLFEFNFASTSKIYHSHFSCLLHWLEQNGFIAELHSILQSMLSSWCAGTLLSIRVEFRRKWRNLPGKNMPYHSWNCILY